MSSKIRAICAPRVPHRHGLDGAPRSAGVHEGLERYGDMPFHALQHEVTRLLNNLSIKPDNLFCLKHDKFGQHRDIGFEQLCGLELEEIILAIEQSSKLDYLLSFGGAGGGFELAMAMQYDLRRAGQHTAYLDATSLDGHPATFYTPVANDVDVNKMSNPYWDVSYQNAIHNVKSMAFLVTSEWAQSPYCRQELEWSEANPKLHRTFFLFDSVKRDPECGPALQQISDSIAKMGGSSCAIRNVNDASVGIGKIGVELDRFGMDGKKIEFQPLQFNYAIAADDLDSFRRSLERPHVSEDTRTLLKCNRLD